MDNMEPDNMNDKYSIKNLLFYRAIPPLVIPYPMNKYKIYACTDCGDRFVLESSYLHHINRKSVKISYKCRHCSIIANQHKVFYNRCNLLSHIRSHSFKTATINVADLKIEPLPLSFFKVVETPVQQTNSTGKQRNANDQENQNIVIHFCFECKENITDSGNLYKDRASHYMKYTNKLHSCPFCLLTLPTLCGLKAHMRIHLQMPPYFCPECGAQFSNKAMNYPYNHHCESFNMMRATTRLKCVVSTCKIFHPNDFKNHMKEHHLKKVFKCPFCVVACFNESTMLKHLNSHTVRFSKALIFYQCELCPGRLVLQNHLETHLNAHIGEAVYPCWTCGTCLDNIHNLLDHHIKNHVQDKNMKNIFESLQRHLPKTALSKKVFRVVKRCDQCLKSFNYKCQYDEISILPNTCPYKCTSSSKFCPTIATVDTNTNTGDIKCPLCESKLDDNWEEIKKHYALHHKNHKCLDGKITLTRMDMSKYVGRKKNQNRARSITKRKDLKKVIRTKRLQQKKKFELITIQDPEPVVLDNDYICCKCQYVCENKTALEAHMISHRDPCMAYQCMECSECFVVKTSFSTHLLIQHGISDVDAYITMKQCYNKNALDKQQLNDETDLLLKENQCNVCREQFEDPEELEKHFRMHGMAFLKKNSISKT